MFGEKVSMYILDEAQSGCKLNGLIAISYDCSILIYNVEGNVIIKCLLYVYYMFIICLLYVYNMPIICLLYFSLIYFLVVEVF